MVRVLLEAKAQFEVLDGTGMAPIHLAARNGHTEAVELLLKAKANPTLQDREGRTPMYIARRQQKEDVAKLLLTVGVSEEVVVTDEPDPATPEEVDSDGGSSAAEDDGDVDEAEEEFNYMVAGERKKHTIFSSLWNGGDGW